MFKSLNNAKLLFILHYPPPIHGAAVVGQAIKDSPLINEALQAKYINLSTSKAVEDIGKGGLQKWVRYVGILAHTFCLGLFWRPQLVYITLSSHGAGLLKDSGVVAICRLLGLPHVYHFHNKGVQAYSQTVWGKHLYPWVFKKAKVILLSPLLYPDIAAYVIPNRVYYCANGLPLLIEPAQPKVLDTQPIQLLFLSNLIKSKGLYDLLVACEMLKNQNIKFHCTIAGGEGDITVQMLQTAIHQHNLGEHLTYVGKVQGEAKTKLLASAHLFIHPTHEDCFPLVLLEAMQFGLPIIATSEGAIPEIVTHGVSGFLVPKHAPEAIANQVRIYAENHRLLSEQSQANLSKFAANFQLEQFEQKFLSIIQVIINTPQ